MLASQRDSAIKLFKAYDVRGALTAEVANQIGRAFADWLPEKGSVCVGRDMRPDSELLAHAFINGLRSGGRDVIDLGLVTSEMVYFAVGKNKLAGGAVITASHNPGTDNGIKLYRDQVIAVGLETGLSDIRDKALSSTTEESGDLIGKYTKLDIASDWLAHCLTFVDKNLKAFHIAIDAGNGMAGQIISKLLPKLPLVVEKMYFKPDGTFPNHEANPQKLENIQALINRVTTRHLDFGVAFDADGDRAVFVDDLGRPVQGSDLISIVAKYYLETHPGAEIIFDVRTSHATEELIKGWGGIPIRTKAGRVNIGSLMRKRKAPFGGETTGHLFFDKNYYADAGLITMLITIQAISKYNMKLSEIVNQYQKYTMLPELNIEFNGDLNLLFKKLADTFEDGTKETLDGLTITYPDYWFNIRASNTEPLIRLNVEANSKELADGVIRKITALVHPN